LAHDDRSLDESFLIRYKANLEQGSHMQKHDKVAPQINLIKMPVNVPIEFELDQDTDWVKEILLEMNENATEKTPEEYMEDTSIYISGVMEKKDKPDLGEYLIVNCTIESDYVTECVRTLKPMTSELDISFKICFIDETLASSEQFVDLDETYVENDIYELYFYNKRTVEFKEMIHEQIFLNYNQYPVLDADSKLEGVDSHIEPKSE
jgi:uncharacterized metal-binding protein YceD (DUF177 family)